jgi:hypothetical protein
MERLASWLVMKERKCVTGALSYRTNTAAVINVHYIFEVFVFFIWSEKQKIVCSEDVFSL